MTQFVPIFTHEEDKLTKLSVRQSERSLRRDWREICFENFTSDYIWLGEKIPDLIKKLMSGFPGGAVVENLPANAGDTGSVPGLGRSHMPRSN